MRCTKNYSFLILLSFLVLPNVHSSSNCITECGGIDIPFPFGMGDGCYLDEWYEIKCQNNTSGKDIPILYKLNMEVVKISFPANGRFSGEKSDSLIRVKSQITSMGCSSNGDKLETSLNLTGTPFFFGDGNSLVAVGCNTKASLTNVEPRMVGCESTCTTSKISQTIPFFDKLGCSNNDTRGILPTSSYIPVCNTTTESDDTICNGKGCCQVKPPSAQQLIGVTITNSSNGNVNTEGGCKVAFLTDEVYSFKNASKPQDFFAKGYAIVRLGWFIQTFSPKNPSFVESLHCQNKQDYDKIDWGKRTAKCTCVNSTISEIIYASCTCSPGYRGNPYIANTCQDINECLEEIETICGRDSCKNQPGGYRCVRDNKFEIMKGVAAGLCVLILFGGIWRFIKFLKTKRMTKRKRTFFKRNGGLLLQQQLHTTQGSVEKTKIFSSRELEKATDNFNVNRVIGQGGQGTVYKGMLVDGKSVAVKKSTVVDEDKVQEFINEVFILSQINHRHVVKLLGCCLETEVPVLVYEFVTNGNLFQHLHEEFDDYTVLWGVRMRIAVDIAGAFSYLHSAASAPIYHRDIKSTNILLDEKYRARVSDFGTSRTVTIDQTHWTTVVSGTVGYVDPEYYGSSQYTEKSDVYSFGVVLVELITGEKPVVTIENTQQVTGLADYFRLAMKENKLFEIIDARVRNDCKLEQVIAVANIAMRCLKKTGKNRPDMREVSTTLERIYSSPEEFQVQIQVDGEEKFYRGHSSSSVSARRTT